MLSVTPHLQYVVVLTPLLLGVACSAGSMLLAVVTGGAGSHTSYGTTSIVVLVYSLLYWVRDNSGEEQDGVLLHIGSLSIIAGVLVVVISEAALFSGII